MSSESLLESQVEVQKKLDRLCSGVDVLKEKQGQMAEDISKIKEAGLRDSA